MVWSLPGSSVHGILQVRIVEQVPFPSPGDLLNPGFKPWAPALQADSLPSNTPGKLAILESNKYILFYFYLCVKEDQVSECLTEVVQSCLTLCDRMDYRLPGSSVHGIFQARILEQVAISFSRGSSQPRG